MKNFRVNEKIEIICESKKTRSGFKHIATLLINGSETDNTKCCYLNRTWERYEYQSVLSKIIEKTKILSKEEKVLCNEFIENPRRSEEELSGFKTVGMVAKLGEVFCESKKEKNDWKKKMIKAGLENQGLSIPEDWDTLSEEEKETRLNGVIEVCFKNGIK